MGGGCLCWSDLPGFTCLPHPPPLGFLNDSNILCGRAGGPYPLSLPGVQSHPFIIPSRWSHVAWPVVCLCPACPPYSALVLCCCGSLAGLGSLAARAGPVRGEEFFFLNRSQSSSQSDWMLDSGRVHTHIHPGRNTQRRFSPTAAAAAAPAGQSNRIYNYTRRRPPCPCPFLSNKKGRGTRWATRTAGACHRICDYH
jgi:hypothetical protein